MAISNMKAVFQNDIKDVWNVVTSLENYQWRSDLSKIEVISDQQFVEYTKDGYATTFTITAAEPFVKSFLKRQQSLYLADLRKALQ